MSEVPPQLPPPPNPALLPVLAAVTYLVAVIGAWGLLSFALDRDVVDYPDAGPLLGPAMVAVACVVTWAALWGSRASRRSWAWITAALLGSYAAMLLAAGIGHSFTAFAHFAISPFIAAAAVLSGLTVLVVRAAQASNRR
ncbi:MAG: hypothetical protein JWP32_2301 [Schumannella sp.]|nr:hypothetical protein [Schumannella sp.]